MAALPVTLTRRDLALTNGAIERRTARLPGARDRTVASGGATVPAFTIVDAESRLPIPLRLLQRNGAAQYRLERGHEPFTTGAWLPCDGCERRCSPAWRQLRAVTSREGV